MSRLDLIQYALGCACLIGVAVTAAWTLWSTIAPNAGRIIDTLFGRNLPPAAPATPHVASTPSRRGVGAAAAPASRVR